ncbi:hypothetical protein K469DRAFT_744184 [Zopfia rhizophila CBS 207.26]|uniref:Uncharacterized protein n=1 Tax=Zopfia rhizophila CBS 207.26 TaxID=1314779 RepID=A0A6A6EVU4_9PEZI|nr:hypothetical protein K469DRAFT_744184 [Zopfia rhizophila CBS 207.26]
MAFTITRKPCSRDTDYRGSIELMTSPTSDKHIVKNLGFCEILEDNELDLSLRPVSSLAQAAVGAIKETPKQPVPPVQIATRKLTPGRITWQSPVFIVAMLTTGLALSLGHHFYYLALSGTSTGDAAKQAWPIRFGTAFAFLVCSAFRATIAAAVQQYVWKVVRQRSLTTDFGKMSWTIPTSQIALNLATQAALSIDTVPISPPVQSLDWSYDLSFYGPSVQCNTSNNTQQLAFNDVTHLFEEDGLFVFSQVNDSYWLSNRAHAYLLFSAWATSVESTPNNWYPICNAVNASFDITIASVNGTQRVIQREVQKLGNSVLSPGIQAVLGLSNASSADQSTTNAYLSHFNALCNLLVGNVTTTGYFSLGDGKLDNTVTHLIRPTSNMLSTGLTGCDEIQNSPFRNVSLEAGLFNESAALGNAFPTHPGMCRNQTLLRAVEDLANNITLSYLSSSYLTDSNTAFRNITTSNTISVYEYHPLYLLLSYGIGFLFALIAAAIGILAIIENGVSHSAAFSAIIATTRNPELDALTRGASLGAEPLPKEIQMVKLRFGPLLNTYDAEGEGEQQDIGSENVPHIAFGFEKSVGRLQKGALYQ